MSGNNGHDLGADFIAPPMPELESYDVKVVEPPEPEEQEPIFEVIVPSELAGVDTPAFHLKFWPDGRIAGFEALAARKKRMTVINRIPGLINTLFSPLRDYVEDVDSLLNVMAPTEAHIEREGEHG